MKNFQILDETISRVSDINYWEEIESDNMRAVVAKFQREDWAALESALSHKSGDWKARCAQILDANQSVESFTALLEILTSQDAYAVIRAIYSLESFEQKFEIAGDRRLYILDQAKLTIEKSSYSESAKSDYLDLLGSTFSK